MIKLITIAGLFLAANVSIAQPSDVFKKIDSLITAKSDESFNGVVIISEKGKIKYSNYYGYSNKKNKISLKENDQFVIGSISKQVTAVLVLQAYEQGLIRLHVPIKSYLPELCQTWADTVTVHQLLTHTHGISEDYSQNLAFKAGTQFSYSQSGYELLSKIIEKTSGKSFAEKSSILFKKCKMKDSYHPDLSMHKNLVTAYVETGNGDQIIVSEKEVFNNAPVAAGGFISTAKDLALWNNCLHKGKLLSENTYKIMISKQANAIREHPIFGLTYYGYGITIANQKGTSTLGLTGFAPGFVSLNFYFPETQKSVIILENVVHNINNIHKTFYYHVQILKIITESLEVKVDSIRK